MDSSCIDCDACREICGSVFARVGGQSAVVRQPAAGAERRAALQALLACPTSSIRSGARPVAGLQEAAADHPIRILGLDDVFYCGYCSENSYAASSYFIRGENGNVLVDCPRFDAHLVKRVETLGGLSHIFLTHRDDVYGHERWAAHFSAKRVVHELEAIGDLAAAEVILRGAGPWSLDGEPLASVSAAPAAVLFVPGHTAGHCALLRAGVLFTGDTLAYDPSLGRLQAFRDFCWDSFEKQRASLAALRGVPFRTVLPGHGRRHAFGSVAEKDSSLEQLLLNLKAAEAS